MSELSIPLVIQEGHGRARAGELVQIGVPCPRGWLRSTHDLSVVDPRDGVLATQTTMLARWPDGSAKWVLVQFVARMAAHERAVMDVQRVPRGSRREQTAVAPPDAPGNALLLVTQTSGQVDVATGAAQFRVTSGGAALIATASSDGDALIQPPGLAVVITDRRGQPCDFRSESLRVDDAGPVAASVTVDGNIWRAGSKLPVRVRARMTFVSGSTAVRIDVRLRNTAAASHPGGAWDLGQEGAWRFTDLSLSVAPAGAQRLRWYANDPSDERLEAANTWTLYQDSSGGENWNSPNHIDAESRSTVTFRGYRVTAGGVECADGLRANPAVTVETLRGGLAVAVDGFWQNFPKALRWQDGMLSVGLFPRESSAGFELQGGEQKRHTLLFDFAGVRRGETASVQHPLAVRLDPTWVERTQAVLWCRAAAVDDDPAYAAYIRQIVEGPHAFTAKREIIDEYGWRNYGELYADHEAVRAEDPRRFISHYNNQYDFVYGAFVQFCRSADDRWRHLLDAAARHLIDIDIYHTQEDKAAFNGGLFWHTDHYLPAQTCTHRTYSRKNGPADWYGGGPSNEHNYTSGLLHYHYLTGDPEAAEAVAELADWVVALDDGSRTMFAVVDSGPTGAASKTLESSYHHPGRGAGNSINALLDAYTLTRRHLYLEKAEELLRRCVHPADDIAGLGLDDPEHRWSYLVFLQIVGKYLALKAEWGEIDYGFRYAQASLLHYARWMLEHEVPYKDVLHKVEIPTETWPAHDVRKAHVLYVAAQHADQPLREALAEKASYFFSRCLQDVNSFSTAFVTRPLVVLCVFGYVRDYFAKQVPRYDPGPHNYDFGLPVPFVPQRARLRSTAARSAGVFGTEAVRVARDAWHVLGAKAMKVFSRW